MTDQTPERDGPHNAMLEGHAGEVRDYWLERLIMLSDGVFAVAITLLAVEMHPPEHWDGSWMGLWAGLWQKLGAYFVTFCAVGAYWLSHRRTFVHIRRADPMLSILNLLALGLVTLLPAGAELIYTYGPRDNALILYMLMVASIGIVQALVFGWAALIAGLVTPTIPMGLRIMTFLSMLLIPPTILVGIFFGLLSRNWPVLAVAVAGMFILGRIRRQLAKHEPGRQARTAT